MRILLFILAIWATNAKTQINDYNIRIGPDKDQDSVYCLVTATTGSNFVGRGQFVNLIQLAAMLDDYITAGAIGDGDKGDVVVTASGTTWSIDNNAITNAKLFDDAVDHAEIAPNAVRASEIQSNAVTGVKIMGNTIDSTKIMPNAIRSSELSSTAVVSGTYSNPLIAIDEDGRITAASNGSAVTPSDTSTMLLNYPTKGEAVLLATDQSVNGEKTFNDSLRVDDYALFSGLNGGVSTMIEMLKDGTFQIDSDNGSVGDGRVYMRMNPYTSANNNTSFNFSMTRQDNTGIVRDNDVFNMGFNLTGGGALERDNIGESAMGLSFENLYRFSGSDYSEFHLFFIDTNNLQYRPITFYLNRYNPLLWTGSFHVPEIEFRPPADVDPYFEFTNPDGIRAQMKMYDPVSNTGVVILSNPASNLFQLYPVGLTDSEINMKLFEYAEVKRLQITTSLGGEPNKLWGESSGGWHEKVTIGNGLEFSGTTIRQNISSSAPANASATGYAGQMAYDGSFLYICTATNTWRRIAHSTW